MIKNTLGPFADMFGRTSSNYQLHIEEKYHWLNAKYRMFPGSMVYNLSLTEPKEIQSLLQRVRAREIPNEIWVENIPENKQAIQAVEDAGMQLFVKYPAMHLEAEKIKRSTVESANYTVRLVENDEDLLKWATVLIKEWWQGGEERVTHIFEVYKELYPLTSKFRLYLAEVNGVPVGISLGVISGELVGLFLIFTHSAYRGRGIGKMLTLQPMLDASQLGVKDIVLQATPEGQVIYKQLGFRELFDYHIYGFTK